MKELYGEFTFHPVGQGLFYSGFLMKGREQLFSFVYDCGSSTTVRQRNKNRHLYLETEIAKFLAKNQRTTNNNEKLIDLLVISHFDEDHINGITQLLDSAKVNTVVIPYYNSKIRNALQIYAAKNGNEEYLDFLKDPYGFFSGRAQTLILAVSKNDLQSLDEINFYPGNFGFESILQTQELSQFNNFRNIKIFTDCLTLSVNNSWVFSFFNKTTLKEKIQSYCDVIDNMIKGKQKGLSELIKDRELIKQITKKTPFKTANLNSVLCCHYKGECNSYIGPDCLYSITKNNNLLYGATLLTGDLNEPSQKDEAEIKEWLRRLRCSLQVFLVPHHGAKNYLTDYSFSPVTVISFGTRNRYRHPSKEVLKDICRSKTDLKCVHEFQEYRYYIIPPFLW